MFKVFQFIYGMYEYYFIFFAALLGTFVGIKIFKVKLSSIYEKCYFYCSIIMIGFIFAIYFTNHFWRERNGFREHVIAFSIENMLTFFLGILLCFILHKSLVFYKDSIKIRLICNSIKDNRWGLFVFLYLLSAYIIETPAGLAAWNSTWYIANYSMGIGSRFFIGTIMSVLFGDSISGDDVHLFCTIMYIVIMFFVSLLVNILIKNAKEKYVGGIKFTIIMLLASPISVEAIWTENFGRLEMYGLLFALISLIIFEKVKNVYIKYALISLLSCMAIAVYQGNLFMYYPIIVMLIVYDVLKEKKTCYLKKTLGLSNLCLTGLAFGFFQFFSFVDFESVDEMMDALANISSIPIDRTAIDLELFQPISVAYREITMSFLDNNYPRERAFLVLIVLLPIIVYVMGIYFKCSQNRKERGIGVFKAPYIYFLLLLAAIIPQYLLNIDWGRWMTATNIVMFVGILYLAYKEDTGMVLAMERISVWLENNKFLSCLVVVWLASMNKFTWCFNEEIAGLFEWLIDHQWIG